LFTAPIAQVSRIQRPIEAIGRLSRIQRPIEAIGRLDSSLAALMRRLWQAA
jgi:hypothetical protein